MLREAVSNLIHLEWLRWAKTIIKTEPNLSVERKTRWESECFKDYEDLSEEQKNLDRMFADRFIKLNSLFVSDRYLDTTQSIKRLKEEVSKYGSIYIAFDFDNTVFDFHKVGDTFPKLELLLQLAKVSGHKLILFTGNEGDKLTEIVQYCTERDYTPDYINENPLMTTRKPYYNILLDDRAGLNESYTILKTVLC